MDTLDSIKAPVAKELAAFESHFKSNLNTSVPLLDTITNYVIRKKGKQIRPLFVFLSAKLAGEITQATFTAASLIELLHTATLLHDDVVDESYERRNNFSINAIWKTKIAVLVGDYFLARGLLLAVAEKEYKILETVSEAVREMSEGELLQIQTSSKLLIDKDNYFEIIKKKTASLIVSCTVAGVQTATTDEKVHQYMREFGTNAGIAFQIKDDILDYQKRGITGKPTGNDIKEKKFTLPLILALKNAKKDERKKITKILFSNNKSTANINEVIEFVTRNKGIVEASEHLNHFKSKALEALATFPQSETRTALQNLIEYIISRSK